MKLSALVTFLRVVVILGLIAGPPAWALHHQRQVRNFRVVRDGVLYRSGQTSLPGLKRLIHDYGIRTVVSLRDARDAGAEPPDHAEEVYCREQGLLYVRIPPRNWWAPDGPAPVQVGVDRFLKLMRDPDNHPVLVHCFAGVHRTGAYCAVYRMEFDGWTNSEALAEMKACGYDNLDEEWDILGYLENYRTQKVGTGVVSDPNIVQD